MQATLTRYVAAHAERTDLEGKTPQTFLVGHTQCGSGMVYGQVHDGRDLRQYRHLAANFERGELEQELVGQGAGGC